MANITHKIGSVTMVQTPDDDIILKRGSDLILMSIDEARGVAAHIEEVIRMSSESAKGMIEVSFRELATHHERDDGTKRLMDWDGSQMYVIAGGDL